MLRHFSTICLCCLILFANLALAQTETKGPPLTSERVANFITAMKQIRKIDKRSGGKGALENKRKGGKRDWSPFAGADQSIQEHSEHKAMLSAINSAGFKNAGEWAQTGTRVYRAYGALKMGAQQPQLEAKMAKARQQIEKSKMSPEQKKKILKMMEQQMGAFAAFKNVPTGDKSAVKPYLAKLDAMNK